MADKKTPVPISGIGFVPDPDTGMFQVIRIDRQQSPPSSRNTRDTMLIRPSKGRSIRGRKE